MSIKPSTPKGTRDFSSEELSKRNYIKNILQKSFESFGFSPIETPSFERLETLTGVYGEEGDRLVFKILNSGEKIKKADLEAFSDGDNHKFTRSISEKALRYDLTVPFARFVAQHQNELIFPYRRYQIQPVWRADRPQYGRYQEFYQCDADIVGERSLWQEVDMISLYDRAFSALKIKGVLLKVNHRKILAGIMGLLNEGSKLIDFTTTLDKIDKIGHQGVLKELAKNNFSDESLKIIEKILNLHGEKKNKISILKDLLSSQEEGLKGLSELEFILDQFKDKQLESVKLEFDLSLARGLHYYTGMIIEVKAPDAVKIGSIGGGGRYDDLTSNFGLKNMSGIGISFGFERIYLVMNELGIFPKTLSSQTQVLFANFGEKAAQVSYYYLNQLRNKNITGELYPTEAKLKKQLNYANSKGIQNVILIGSEELEGNSFILKNMSSGEQTSYSLPDIINLFN